MNTQNSSNVGFSSYLQRAARNERANALNLPGVFALLEQLEAALAAAVTAAQRQDDGARLAPRFLLGRGYACCLAAARLALSGQVIEGFMPLRGAIEASWYALHMSADPAPLNRVEIWMGRHNDDASKERCKREFTIKNVHQTHLGRDAEVAAIFHRLYEATIDLGAHPNPRSILGVLTETETPDGSQYNMAILTTDQRIIVSTLERVVDVGIGVLKTFQLVFPQEFAAAGLAATIDRLIDASSATFRAWVEQAARD